MKKVFSVIKASIAALLAMCILVVGLLCYVGFGVLLPYYNVPNENKAVAAYDVNSGLINDDMLAVFQSKDIYELGVNKDGKVVFQHPRKAFKEAKKACKEARKYEDKTYDLKHMSKTAYIAYIDAGKKVINDDSITDKDLKAQAFELSSVLEIYANSFNRHR